MKNLIITLGMMLLFSACSKFTDIGLPKNQITRDLVFKDEGLANAAMAGVYRSLEEAGFLTGSSSAAPCYLSCYTDELMSYAATGTDISQFYTLTHNSLTGAVTNLWTVTYKQIYYINSVIEGLEHSENISPSVKERLTGEALFLRALLHLYLSNTFGKIPYIKTTAYDINSRVGREDQLEVYDKIKNDLVQAAGSLPDKLPRGSRVRPTKMAVFAVLARLFYYQKQWDEAIEYSSYVLSQSDYESEKDIDLTFLKESSSAIWQLLPYNSTYNTNEGNLFILNTAPPATVALDPLFVCSFEAGDLRRIKWVGEIKDAQNNIYYYPFKYKQSSITAATLECSILLRVEELHLIRAEAFIQRNELDLGTADLNEIRARVNLPAIGSKGQAELLAAVLQERKSELFTEFGHRFYDMIHFGVLDKVMLLHKSSWKRYFRFWPIPEQELLRNPKLKPQNDGY